MDLTEFLLIFAMFWKMNSGLRCYRCEATFETYKEPLCEQFNFSSNVFLADCDQSSMCYKRVTTTQFGTIIYERGCAKQVMNGYQELRNGTWRYVTKINEVYEEGCVESPGDVERVTRTEHCYCRGDLCNSATVVASSVFAIGITAIGLLIADCDLKYSTSQW